MTAAATAMNLSKGWELFNEGLQIEFDDPEEEGHAPEFEIDWVHRAMDIERALDCLGLRRLGFKTLKEAGREYSIG